MTDKEKDQILEDVNARNDWDAIYDNRDEVPEEFLSEFIEFINLDLVFHRQKLSRNFLEEHRGYLGERYEKYKAIYTLSELEAKGDENVLLDLVQFFAWHDNDRSRLYRYVSQDSQHIHQIFVNREAEDLRGFFKEEYGNSINFNVFQRAAQFNLDIYEVFFNGMKTEMTKDEFIGTVDDLRKKYRLFCVSVFTSEFDALSSQDVSYVNLVVEPVEGVGEYPIGISMIINFEVSPVWLKDK